MPLMPRILTRPAHQGTPTDTLPERQRRLQEWAKAAPAGEQRAAVIERIEKASRKGLKELNLSDLKFSSLPIEPVDVPSVLRLDLGRNRIEQLSTAWVDKITGLADLGGKIQSLENQIQWADLLAKGTSLSHKEAAIYHNLHLGLRLEKSGQHAKEIAGCKDAVWRLSLALARALELDVDVPIIAKHLLAASPPELQIFEIDGVLIARSEIDSIAGGRPTLSAEQKKQLDQVFLNFRQGWAANVHQGGLLSAGAVALRRLQQINQVAPPTLDETVKHVSDLLASDHEATKGLKFALAQKSPVNEGGLQTNVADTLRQVWAYCFRHETLRDPLIEAFAGRLREIARDQCCNTGCVQRLLQTPEGVDEAFSHGIPDEKTLREEIAGLVPRLNLYLDEQIEHDQKAWNEAERAQSSASGADTDAARERQAALERQAFEAQLQLKGRTVVSTIRKTYVDLRGIPASMVDDIAKKPLEDLEKNELYLTDRTLGDLSVDYRDVFGRSALFKAVTQNDLESVRKQIEAGADFNFVNDSGSTSLFIAALNGHTEVVSALVNAQADVNKAHKDGFTPLYAAAQYGRTEIVRALLNSGADVDKADKDGFTPLYIAAQNGHMEIVRALLDAGADVVKANKDGFTPLCVAAQNGHMEIVRALLDAGADVVKANKDGFTPFYIAAQYGRTEIVRALLDAGADVDKADKDGFTPLYIAAQNGHMEIVRALLDAGADVVKANKHGFTPLYVAAQNGHVEIVRALLDAGADVDKANKDGFTPLYMAAQYGRSEIVRALLDAGADVDKANKHGFTPLYIAAQNGHMEIVRALLNAKADVNKADEYGFTPLCIAARKGHTEIVRALLDARADIDKANEYGFTPLCLAAEKGHTEIVRALLNAKADVNKADKDGLTPLYMAAQNGHTEIVRALLNAIADVNVAHKDGFTPLYMAAQDGHTEIVRALLSAEADVNKARKGRVTPLHIAASEGHMEVVKTLLSVSGIDVMAKTHSGFSARRLALHNGHHAIAELLDAQPAYQNTVRHQLKKLFKIFKY